MLWIDFAKAVSLILVLHLHANFYSGGLASPHAKIAVTLPVFIDVLSFYARLPIFFFVSGMLAARRIAIGATTGLGTHAYLYFLWALIYVVVISDWPHFCGRVTFEPGKVAAILWGGSVVWYLWAIAIAFLVARWTRLWPTWLVIGIAALMTESQFAVAAEWGAHLGSLLRCLPFYLLGARIPTIGGMIADSRSAMLAISGILAYFLFGLLVPSNIPFVSIAADLAGLILGLMAAGWAARCYPGIVSPVSRIGKQTLPVYILHFPIIAVVGLLSIRLLSPLPAGHFAFQMFAPMLTAIVLVSSLLLYRSICGMGGGWLFHWPVQRSGFSKRPANADTDMPDGIAAVGEIALRKMTD
ncbi:hypothetical protein BH10PSE12_BH10PSE12_27780 [soil metagenome]